jgi:hypothetical protein
MIPLRRINFVSAASGAPGFRTRVDVSSKLVPQYGPAYKVRTAITALLSCFAAVAQLS